MSDRHQSPAYLAADINARHLLLLGGLGYLVRAAQLSLSAGRIDEARDYLEALSTEIWASVEENRMRPK